MSPSEVDSTKDVEKKPSQRRINKPLIEKRRRARINDSLDQLKSIVLEASDSKGPRPSKLEKADILEMTVEFIKKKSLISDKRQVPAYDVRDNDQSDETQHGQYSAGYAKCLSEISKYLTEARITDETSKKLIEHISLKVNKSNFNENASETVDGDLKNGKIRIEPLIKRVQKETPGEVEGAIDLSMRGKSKSEQNSSEMTNRTVPVSTDQPINVQTLGHVVQQVPVGLVPGSHVMLLVQLSVANTMQQQQLQILPQNVISLNPQLQTLNGISSAEPCSQLPGLSNVANMGSSSHHGLPTFVTNYTQHSLYASEVPNSSTSTTEGQQIGNPPVFTADLPSCQLAECDNQNGERQCVRIRKPELVPCTGENETSNHSTNGDLPENNDKDQNANPQCLDPDHWRPW